VFDWMAVFSARIREKVEGGINSQKGSCEAQIFSPSPHLGYFVIPPEGVDNKSRGGMTIFAIGFTLAYTIHYCLYE